MANIEAVRTCYAVLVDPFGSTAGRDTPHRGADYRVPAGAPVVAYEKCTVINSDLKSSFLGYSVVAKRHRDGKYIGWAHLRVGTRPAAGTVLEPGDVVGLCAGFNDYHGSSWSGPHSHTTEGGTELHIYQGQNTDPHPDIVAAKSGVAGGGTTPVINYHWYGLTAAAMKAIQQLLTVAKLYNGPDDGDFGKNSVVGLQEYLKRTGYLPADYEADGIPHNPDQNAPSNYGYALQKWAAKHGYNGKMDGLPAAYTSEFLVKAANADKAKLQASPTPTPPPVVQPPIITVPKLPVVPAGYFFFPDLGSSQGMFDFAEFKLQGGRTVALKMGGGNAGDSPYVAPYFKDQLDRARKQSLRIIKYWFNGNKNNLTPEASADFFALHAEIVPGEIVAIDIEDETATGTKAWTPAEAVRFVHQLRKHYPGIKGVAYMSDSLADREDWTPLKALGWELWNASWGTNNGDPGVPPTSDEWTEFMAWQYTSKETVPGNYSGTPRVYGETDGNMGRDDMFDRCAWVLPPVVDPDPETPADAVQTMAEYFAKAAALNAEYAAKLAPSTD